ncbi:MULTISPECIES: EscU/YscU/HrcU family type III secretion system export apparatus switch protein [unclassified Legionella]|uniref:EscU/YscU/HrcU family type III secretion system export apparatus switch protein n=1 Tax=unclassified Legionella TaxID=2622702 RepID=UPI0010560824|nr:MULTISPECIES: EscU/YscU/HrcU family type III secretion system export apparatus switch protein [unclassified Legionella]MDI9818621.1 EscU/YscU/HrcU family type III secretion system export apparatus switch protein [Legionella sp. PL877]
MKKKKKQAIALHYDGKSAPKVTAKGEGLIAEQIIRVAKQQGIPLQQNEQLTTLLSEVKLNQEIPPKLYIAVAQLLTFLYHINGKTPKDYHE